jgi:hypothetical protein
MSKFWQSFQRIPWRELFTVAIASNLALIALELLLGLSLIYSPPIRASLQILFRPPLVVLLPVGIAIAMGALAVYLMEKWRQQYLLNRGNLWALVLCLLLTLTVKQFIQVPLVLVDLSQISLMGIIIGVFWKGRPYW